MNGWQPNLNKWIRCTHTHTPATNDATNRATNEVVIWK